MTTAIRKLATPPFDIEIPTYHGIPTLRIHVDEPLPTPPTPERYVIEVGPDLARYLLSFNISDNRSIKPRRIEQLVSDMIEGRYLLSPQSGCYFDTNGRLFNGQNTLNAVIDAAAQAPGTKVWMVIEFGWPPKTVGVIDRGTGRSAADTLKIEGIPNSSAIAASLARAWQLTFLFGKTRSLSGFASPSQPQISTLYHKEPELWQDAIRTGARVYKHLDKGGSPAAWASMYFLFAKLVDEEAALNFMDEVADGSGGANSATMKLRTWYTRRPESKRDKTGDTREFYEIVIRAFNAWRKHKQFSFPVRGFALSRIEP